MCLNAIIRPCRFFGRKVSLLTAVHVILGPVACAKAVLLTLTALTLKLRDGTRRHCWKLFNYSIISWELVVCWICPFSIKKTKKKNKKTKFPVSTHVRINHALDNQPTLSSYDDGVTFNNKPPPPPTRLQADESIMSVTKSMMENTSFSFVLFFLFLAAWNDLTDACFSRYIAMRVQNVSRTSRSSWKCTIRRCRLAGRCRLNAASFPT